ncbi:MAG: archaemetzincin [Pirellulales bacterium]
MTSAWRISAASLAIVALAGCAGAAEPQNVRALLAAIDALEPLHTPLGKPQSGDWLTSHEERGQTFRAYLSSKPVTPRGKRKVIYVQPLGDFSATQKKLVDETAAYLAIYFNREVKQLEPLGLDVVPAKARRKHPNWGMDQILTTYVLDDVLRPKLPADAAASIALTASDLWPGEGWNFVFGQASLRNRVGVWSLYRNGDPDKSDEEFRLCLLRTLKTASHEMGHMFSMPHCTAFECNMCGSNNREESDRRPLAECPQCMAKICWACEIDPATRYEKLAAFCRERGLREEAEFFSKSAMALKN